MQDASTVACQSRPGQGGVSSSSFSSSSFPLVSCLFRFCPLFFSSRGSVPCWPGRSKNELLPPSTWLLRSLPPDNTLRSSFSLESALSPRLPASQRSNTKKRILSSANNRRLFCGCSSRNVVRVLSSSGVVLYLFLSFIWS